MSTHNLKNTLFLAKLALLTAATIAFEMLGLPQPITGPVVNMMLILTALVLNSSAGVFLGCITPLVAVLRGQLPPPLLPMLPFIMLANTSLVLCFQVIRTALQNNILRKYKLDFIIALIAAATVKFLILYGAVVKLVPLFIGNPLPTPFVLAMSLPQLITALVGGVLAGVVYNLIEKSRALYG